MNTALIFDLIRIHHADSPGFAAGYSFSMGEKEGKRDASRDVKLLLSGEIAPVRSITVSRDTTKMCERANEFP